MCNQKSEKGNATPTGLLVRTTANDPLPPVPAKPQGSVARWIRSRDFSRRFFRECHRILTAQNALQALSTWRYKMRLKLRTRPGPPVIPIPSTRIHACIPAQNARLKNLSRKNTIRAINASQESEGWLPFISWKSISCYLLGSSFCLMSKIGKNIKIENIPP